MAHAGWVYREIDQDPEELRIVVAATTAPKQIENGVTARVVRETVSQDGEVVEDTFDWFARARSRRGRGPSRRA